MQDSVFEALLHQALEDHMTQTAQDLLQAADSPPPIPSHRHRRRMKALLGHPNAHTPWQRGLQRAAILLVTVGLSGAVLLSFPQVRAAVRNLVKQIYETHNDYTFTEPNTADLAPLPHLAPQWLPESFEETGYFDRGNTIRIEYQNDFGEIIDLTYSWANEGSNFIIDREHYSIYPTMQNGIYYEVYESTDPEWENWLVWLSSDESLCLRLSSSRSLGDLFRIAEGIS